MSKTELLERLWSATFVTDASLHNLVAEVRAAIGDTPQAARFIRTVPRVGYGFHGDAQTSTTADQVSRAQSRSGPQLVSKRREWRLSEGPNVVGRDRDCAVSVDSPSVSRRHARIIVASGEATIEDLGSKNGTYVNGQRVKNATTLEDGSQLRVGSVTMVYRSMSALPSTVTQGPR